LRALHWLPKKRKKAHVRWRWNRRRHHADQAASAADQSAADTDQTASDTDQTASDRDQGQADADQRAAERDQTASDRDLASHTPSDPDVERSHELSRVERAKGALDRQAATLVRAQVSTERDEQAKLRDQVAQKRDQVAEQRDRAAEERDNEIGREGEEMDSTDPRATRALEALAEMRDKSATHRTQAASDRARAARDREAAAEDRRRLLSDVEQAHLDELTGAYRRGMGKTALVNEIERARRYQGTLALAYIDCDGLKDVNNREGHGAGDALLRDLVDLLRSKLRPYDPVVRWGGDEFICAISDTSQESALRRFEEIRAALAEREGAGVTIGLAVLEEGDTLESLIKRADAALLEARDGR
jgi:diguanylate cyclase (GGDEF)-like protein